jgi:MFS family permease
MVRRVSSVVPDAAPGAAGTPLPAGTRGIVWCYAAMGFGYILPATFLPVLARSVVDDPRLFGLAWPVFGATAVVSMFVAGWWLARVTRLRVWAVSQLLMGVGVLLPSLWLSGATIALSALLVGGTFMVVTLAGVQEARALAPGISTRLVARMTTAFAAGQIAGPVLSALLTHWPALREQGLNVALQCAALALLASGAWLWRRAAHHNTSKEMTHVR